MERRAFLLGMLGALTAAAGFTVTTTASAGAHFPLAADGATDANDVTAEDLAAPQDQLRAVLSPSRASILSSLLSPSGSPVLSTGAAEILLMEKARRGEFTLDKPRPARPCRSRGSS